MKGNNIFQSVRVTWWVKVLLVLFTFHFSLFTFHYFRAAVADTRQLSGNGLAQQ